MDIDAAVLRSFLVVAAEGTVTAAARRLYVSQPALSAQLRRLERAVGVSLFERQPSGMHLTQAGQAFAPYAERALAALEQGLSEAAAANGQGTLRFDVLDDSLQTPRRVVDCLRRRLPGIVLELSARGSEEQVRRLRSGQLDLALTGKGAPRPGLHTVPLVDEPLGVALAEGHPLAGQASVLPEQLRSERHYLPAREFAAEWVELVTRLFQDAGFAAEVVPLHTESSSGPLQVVAAGECVAVSLLSTPVPPGVVMRPLHEAPHFQWSLTMLDGAAERPLVRSALSALRSLELADPRS